MALIAKPLMLIAGAALIVGLSTGLAATLYASPKDPGTAERQLLAAGTRLSFSGQPLGGNQEGQRLAQDPVVDVRDASGQVDTADKLTVVTLAIKAGTGAPGAVLSCDNDENAGATGVQVRVDSGAAPFFGCRIDKANPANNPYTLTATGGSFPTVESTSFTITAGPTATPTQMATATPTRTPTPTSTPVPLPPPPPVTQTVGPEGSDVKVGGGAENDGGVTLSIPSGTLASSTKVTVSIENKAPSGVTASGGSLLPKTVDVVTDAPVTLSKAAEIQVDLTAAELGGRSIQSVQGGVIVGTSVEPRPTRVIDAAKGTIGFSVDHFSKFSVITVQQAGPAVTLPAESASLAGFGTTLTWNLPSGSTQYHLQVTPFNNDGPGVNIIGDAVSEFTLPAPPSWYGLLPDTTYFWRVRTTIVATTATEADWTAWSVRSFRTPMVDSAGVRPGSPEEGATVASLTPALTWTNNNPAVFYYEVQVSKDARFNTNPGTATAMVYWVLLHGGVTTPLNSYAIPAGFPLEAGTAYNWRVRPRVQADGKPLGWSSPFTFKTP